MAHSKMMRYTISR